MRHWLAQPDGEDNVEELVALCSNSIIAKGAYQAAAKLKPGANLILSHRARLLADLTELGGRASTDVGTYDELRELAYTVAMLLDEQEQVAALEAKRHP